MALQDLGGCDRCAGDLEVRAAGSFQTVGGNAFRRCVWKVLENATEVRAALARFLGFVEVGGACVMPGKECWHERRVSADAAERPTKLRCGEGATKAVSVSPGKTGRPSQRATACLASSAAGLPVACCKAAAGRMGSDPQRYRIERRTRQSLRLRTALWTTQQYCAGRFWRLAQSRRLPLLGNPPAYCLLYEEM